MSLSSSAASSLSNLANIFSSQKKAKRSKSSDSAAGPSAPPPPFSFGDSEVNPPERNYPQSPTGTGEDWRNEGHYSDESDEEPNEEEDRDAVLARRLARRRMQMTGNDPIGRILLSLLAECTTQAGRNGRQMNLGVEELCDLFTNHKISELAKLKHKVGRATSEWEQELVSRKLNSHTLNQSVEPPSDNDFSPCSTLETPKQIADVMRMLPSGGHKFSGAPGKMSILEYLFSLNLMQKQCNLSKAEFMQMMLASTTGKPHIYLMRRIQEKDDLSNIYHNLLLHYDKRMEPEEARIKLYAYKAPKSATLADVEIRIQELASLATSTLPAGPPRNVAYDYEQVQALIRCLPPQSSMLVRNQYDQFSVERGRPAKAGELSRLLNTYRYTIDQDLKAHGENLRSFSDQNRRFNPARPAGKFTRKFTSYNVTQNSNPPFKPPINNAQPGNLSYKNRPRYNGGSYNGGQSSNPPRPFISGPQSGNMFTPGQRAPPYGTPQRFGTPGAHRSLGARNNFGNKRGQGRKPFDSNRTRLGRPGGNRPGGQRDYCSLCGHKDHRAVDGCKNMVTDGGRIVHIMPAKDTCTACPAHVQPRLSHPSHLCPYRVGGPFHGK